MKGEYIRKQDAVMQLSHNKSRGDDEWELAVASDMEIIRKLPPADVVPVVRCRDCKHVRKWRSEESAKKFGQMYECALGVLACPDPNDFCSYGERSKQE